MSPNVGLAVPRGTKVSAIDVKAKTFFERLYLVPGLGTFGPRDDDD